LVAPANRNAKNENTKLGITLTAAPIAKDTARCEVKKITKNKDKMRDTKN